MAQLAPLASWRHVVVGGVAALAGAAGLTGWLGESRPAEHFEAKQITVTPVGDAGIRVREVVDQDFGFSRRHGYERIIPNDFGVPEDISASSPDAPDQVSVTRSFRDSNYLDATRIRIGDPDQTIDNQHRYQLAYTYPETTIANNFLALDVIGTTDTLPTDRLEIIVTGMELADPTCNVGRVSDQGGCTLEDAGDGTYRAVIDDLEPEFGVTIGGQVVERTEPADVPVPPLPERRDSPQRIPMSAALVGISAASGAGVFAAFRRRGRNEIAAGGAADAAFAEPGARGTPTRLVTDSELASMATTEFAPPKGIAPWEGQVLLTEKVNNDTRVAWMSSLAGRDVIDLADEGGVTTLSIGPRYDQASAEERRILDRMFSGGSIVTLKKYSKRFSQAWADIPGVADDEINRRGFWSHPVGRGGGGASGFSIAALFPFVVFGVIFFSMSLAGLRAGAEAGIGGGGRPAILTNPISALTLVAVVTAIVAAIVYRSLLARRTAAGSAAALQVESFRRFLEASEGQHVEWAWKNGMLREYSAWAVSLGAAGAWERAMKQAGLPASELHHGPLIMYTGMGDFRSTVTPPAPTGGGRGGFGGGGGFGGFSGGSVGGGGGGGGSGSW